MLAIMRISTVSWSDTVDLRQTVLGWTAEPTTGDQEPETTHLAATDSDGRIVGVVSMVELPCPEEPDQRGIYFWAMAVDTQFQRRGIGRNLIAELFRRAKTAHAAIVWADARSTAIPFYERCGGTAVGSTYTDDVTGLVDRRIVFRVDHG